jgi:hypothetical protein
MLFGSAQIVDLNITVVIISASLNISNGCLPFKVSGVSAAAGQKNGRSNRKRNFVNS